MVPQIETPSSYVDPDASSIGLLHNYKQEHGMMIPSKSAVLFEIPSLPMLSMFQFRHANLNHFLHGPSYSLGNSYASPQVRRYKVTGLVRGISLVPDEDGKFSPLENDKAQESWDSPTPKTNGQSYSYWFMNNRDSPWESFKHRHNYASEIDGSTKDAWSNIRDKQVSSEHENMTLDHSFLNNRALLDGYFLSGVGNQPLGKHWEEKKPSDFDAGKRYRPYRNPRLVPYLRADLNETDESELEIRQTEESWDVTGYADLQIREDNLDDSFEQKEKMKYQTLAADLLLEGCFNVNSTSVDAWISQLSAFAGQPLLVSGNKKFEPDQEDTPFPRFSILPQDSMARYVNDEYAETFINELKDRNKEGDEESVWNEVRVLSKEEITLLAHCLVEQIKLRGPFLSFADFTNRRIIGNEEPIIGEFLTEWPDETRDSVLGLRGAVQAAVAEAEINMGGGDFENEVGEVRGDWGDHNPQIPEVPEKRFDSNVQKIDSPYPFTDEFKYYSSAFGIHAFHKLYDVIENTDFITGPKNISSPHRRERYTFEQTSMSLAKPQTKNRFDPNSDEYIIDKIKIGSDTESDLAGKWRETQYHPNGDIEWKIRAESYSNNLSNGEGPDSLLGVENFATGANKPGWLMQSDILSPLAPVSSVRSDTFVIRVMGETWGEFDERSDKILKQPAKSWIELTVQRTPDYVKSTIDAPHRRPHEPIEDKNFNGFWDLEREDWLDLNTNDDATTAKGPDLPGVGAVNPGKTYRDGLLSDLPLNGDVTEESQSIREERPVSLYGINQRFGRKFKIIKFRWLREQDV